MSPCACHPTHCPQNPRASLRSHSSTTTGTREIALVTHSFLSQKQKPSSWLLHKAFSADTCLGWQGAPYLSDLIHRHSAFVHHHTPLPLPSQALPGIAIMEILSLSSSIFISKTETCQTCISFVEKQHQSGLSTNLIIHLPQVNQTALYPSLCVHYCLIPSPHVPSGTNLPKSFRQEERSRLTNYKVKMEKHPCQSEV